MKVMITSVWSQLVFVLGTHVRKIRRFTKSTACGVMAQKVTYSSKKSDSFQRGQSVSTFVCTRVREIRRLCWRGNSVGRPFPDVFPECRNRRIPRTRMQMLMTWLLNSYTCSENMLCFQNIKKTNMFYVFFASLTKKRAPSRTRSLVGTWNPREL